MAVPLRITLVTLGVADLARSTAFYEALGWGRAAASTEGVSFFETSTAVLSLYPWTELAGDAGLPGAGSGFRGSSLAINVGSPDEVDRAVAEWVAAGGAVVRAPASVFWGGYIAYVSDLDGHLWEIAHNPAATLDELGRLRFG